MKKLTAKVLASVLAAGVLLTGCSASGSSAASSESSSNSENREESVQEITVAITSQIATLDTGLNSTTHLSQVLSNLTLGLFRTNEHGESEKLMCEDYTISADGLTYTFKIKEGVKWSDGKPLTAHDWVYGIKRTIGYGPDNTFMSADMCRFIKGAQEAHDNAMDVADMTGVGVSAPDDYTLVIELDKVCPYFIKIVGGNSFAPQRADFAVEHESAWSLQPGYPSIGPFVVADVNENEHVILEKNPNYYEADSVQLEKITYLVMPNENAQLNAFKAGQIDMAYGVPTSIASSEEYAEYFFKPEQYTSTYFIALNSGNTGVEALKDVRVRKALSIAIDKETMLTILDGGDYITPLNGFVPYGFEGLDGDFRAEANDYVSYNAEEAKKLLAEAGYNESNPLKLEYLYPSTQFHADVAMMLQQFWNAIGAQVEIKTVEMGVFYDYVDYGDFQMSRYNLNSSTDPLTYLKILMGDNQIEPMFNDEHYDDLIAKSYNLTDHDEYLKTLHEAEKYLIEEQAYIIPLLTQCPVVLKQKDLGGVWAGTTGTIYFEEAYVE